MPPWVVDVAAERRSTALEWIWPGYLPRGKLALLDGDPELGKSLLALDLLARLGRGDPMPDGSPLPRPDTGIFLSAEDDPVEVTAPRAAAAGTAPGRLIVPAFPDRLPRFPDDLPALEELVGDHAAELLVIDPLMAFLPPRVSANVDQCVRLALAPLGLMAQRTRCAVLLIRHLAKRKADRALMRGLGSVGIAAAVRTAMFVAAHPADPALRVLTVSKNNFGRRPPALGYRIVDAETAGPTIQWTGPVDVTADGLSNPVKPAALMAVRDRAVDWLRRELSAGPRTAASVYASAAAAGIPDRTLERAKEAMKARSHRYHDFKANRGEWYWYDPDAPWPKSAPFKKPWELPPLPDFGG